MSPNQFLRFHKKCINIQGNGSEQFIKVETLINNNIMCKSSIATVRTIS